MTHHHPCGDTVRNAAADFQTRTLNHVRSCILLALVTSEDVAAMLIDQAVALHAAARRPVADAPVQAMAVPA